jgi:23S rRNA (pseudouridine1915-N3)-methyltransferase
MLPCAAQVWHKTDDQLLAAVQKEACPTVCLDATGQMLDSLQLSDAVFKKLETGGSRLCFVIGGAEGLPPTLRPPQRGNGGAQSGGSPIEYLSLSRLTFTHQVTLPGNVRRTTVAAACTQAGAECITSIALHASLPFSLSTLPLFQMARVLLAEQIYRASEIRRGSGYHKE